MYFPERELMQELRSMLAAKTGRPVQALLQEQETSLARYTQVVDGQIRPFRRPVPHVAKPSVNRRVLLS
jgi:hypothetical protein